MENINAITVRRWIATRPARQSFGKSLCGADANQRYQCPDLKCALSRAIRQRHKRRVEQPLDRSQELNVSKEGFDRRSHHVPVGIHDLERKDAAPTRQTLTDLPGERKSL